MRKMLFALALLLLIGGAIAWQLQQGEGYILIAAGGWTIEMSLWVGVLLLALLWILATLIKAVLARLFGPERGLLPVWRRTRQRRLRKRRDAGLQDLLEGRWGKAQKAFERTGRKSDEPVFDWLAASTAALERGDLEQARKSLSRAAAHQPDGFGVRLQEARLLLREQAFEGALAVLEGLHSREPAHQEVLRLLAMTHETLGNWLSLEKLLPELKRHRVIDGSTYESLQIKVFAAELEEAGLPAEHELVPPRDRLLAVWERVPAALRRDNGLLAVLVRQLHRAGEGRLAESQLRNALKRSWSDELVELYGMIEHRDLIESLAVAEKWLPTHPNNPVLLLTLGRLCMRAELWGKARDYLGAAEKVGGNSAVFAELAALSAHLGETGRSAHYYRLGLEARGGEASPEALRSV